jgi:hypothetical protein
MENKDKEYAQERQQAGNWVERVYFPKGGLEAELNEDAWEGSELALANWN